MTLTRNMIKSLGSHGEPPIDRKLEARLLQQFGNEPCPHEYTEQDLHEQVRKFIMHYHQDKIGLQELF